MKSSGLSKELRTTLQNSIFRAIELATWMIIFYAYPIRYGIDIYGQQVAYLTYASFTIAIATGTNTAIIKYVLDKEVNNLKALCASLFAFCLLVFGFLAYCELPVYAIAFVLVSIWRNYIYALRRSEYQVQFISKISTTINLLALLSFLANISLFQLLLYIRILEVIFTYRKGDFQFSFAMIFEFLKKQGSKLGSLILPGLAVSLDKLIAIRVYPSLELGIYQIIDQTNVGGYALIMTILYVELPKVLNFLKGGKTLPSYTKLLLLYPIILFAINTTICICFFDLDFSQILTLLIINSLFKFIVFSSGILAMLQLHHIKSSMWQINCITLAGLITFMSLMYSVTIVIWVLVVFMLINKFSNSLEFRNS